MTIVNKEAQTKSPIKIFGQAKEVKLNNFISAIYHEDYFFNPECLNWTSNVIQIEVNAIIENFDDDILLTPSSIRRRQNSKISSSSQNLMKTDSSIGDGKLVINNHEQFH